MKTLKLSIFLLSLFLSSLACQLSEVAPHNAERIPVLTEEAVALSDKLEQAVQEANEKGTFTIEITEQQLTSYVALNLEKNSQVPITDLQIRLRDEQIWISGVVHQDNLQLPLSVGVKVWVDPGNNLAFEFSEAKVGPFQLPKLILDSIAREVEQAFLEQVASVGEGYRIEEISVGEGSILIRGTKQ